MHFCPVIRFYSNSFILKYCVKQGSFSDAFRIYRHMTDALSSLFEVRRLLSHGGARVIGKTSQPLTDWVREQIAFYRFASSRFAKYPHPPACLGARWFAQCMIRAGLSDDSRKNGDDSRTDDDSHKRDFYNVFVELFVNYTIIVYSLDVYDIPVPHRQCVHRLQRSHSSACWRAVTAL